VTRVNQLETLLAQYKSANQALSDEIDAMGGEAAGGNADDPDSLVNKAAWNKEKRVALQKEVEQAREEKADLQQSTSSKRLFSRRRMAVLIILQYRNTDFRKHKRRSGRSDR
jgi:hypothetical protein